MSTNIHFISAGAGSGKTYRLTKELGHLLEKGDVTPSGVIATTFTRLAAGELRERVTQELVGSGQTATANQMGQALIGTVNAVCGELLVRFAFEAGLSPDQKILEEEDAKQLFGEAVESILGEDADRVRRLNVLAQRLQKIDRQKRPDWQQDIQKIVSQARANDMSVKQIQTWGEESADLLMAFFPKPTRRDLDEELRHAIEQAIDGIDTTIDTTKKTLNYLSLLNQSRNLLDQSRLPWSDWIKLSKEGTGSKSQSYADQVRQVAGDCEKHPRLHGDIREFCEEVFDIAAASLEAYQQIKLRLGTLDFVDQEQRLYHLLDHPHVASTLREELQLLMVDEFQDTSPIQLALFVKLAVLANRVVWVGDVKQAIYGFRGSDPELMKEVLEKITVEGGQTEVLPYSWRSRPALVQYANALFAPAFANTLDRQHVVLETEPDRVELVDDPAVAYWQLVGGNYANRASALALGIHDLVVSGYAVVDKQTKRPRAVCYGDIAVLSRTNSHLETIAEAFAEAQIPVAFRRSGLLETPEGALAMACLRRLIDTRDTLASAEIRCLSQGEPAETWLQDRLEYLAKEKPSYSWGEAGKSALPVLTKLKEERPNLRFMTPVEAMETALLKGDIRKVVSEWGPDGQRARHRLQNLDLLIGYAKQYEDYCTTRNLVATVPGLILWLNELQQRELDLQSETSDGDAVTLVTHHRAKGLEWPVVVAMDLDSKLKDRLWGLTVLKREEGFDMQQPLADRRLRYWLWPFGQQKTKIPVKDRIEADAVGRMAHENAVEEGKRLLYVSITRARDLLIIPLSGNNPGGEWMDTLDADWMLPDGSTLELPSGETITAEHKILSAPEETNWQERRYSPHWLKSLDQPVVHRLPLYLQPSRMEPVPRATIGTVVELGERLPIGRIDDSARFGQALHSIISTQIRKPDDESYTRSRRILKEFEISDSIDPVDVIYSANRFLSEIRARFDPVSLQVECPITYITQEGQVAHGFIDLLIETRKGWVIVDHKSSPEPRAEWEKNALEHSGQLELYRDAVTAASNKHVVGTWIHFPVTGGLVEVCSENRSSIP